MRALLEKTTRVNTSSPHFVDWWGQFSNLSTFEHYGTAEPMNGEAADPDTERKYVHWKFHDMKRWYEDILASDLHEAMLQDEPMKPHVRTAVADGAA